MNWEVMIEPAEEGGFTAYVPALPGCVTEGETEEETIAHAREAIALYVDELRAQGRAIPPAGTPSGQGRIVDVPTVIERVRCTTHVRVQCTSHNVAFAAVP